MSTHHDFLQPVLFSEWRCGESVDDFLLGDVVFRVSENEFLPNCTNVKCALDTAQKLSDYVSGARPFANNVTLLQGASSALDHFAGFFENSIQSVNFSLANKSASLATKIGADLTGQAGLPNENPAATNILRSIERIYAIAASTLKVGQKPITYESTGRGGAASNFASVIAAYNSNTSILKQRLSRANARIRACKNVTFNRQTFLFFIHRKEAKIPNRQSLHTLFQ